MKMRQSNSVNIFNPKTLIGKRRQRSIVVYSLAVNDSQGLSTRAFGDEQPYSYGWPITLKVRMTPNG
jgi:hypothetical protein